MVSPVLTIAVRILWANYARQMTNWNNANLSAPFWRIYWNAQGGNFARIASREIELLPSRILAIPPDTPFSTSALNPVDHFHVHFVSSQPFGFVKPEIFVFDPPPSVLALKNRCIEGCDGRFSAAEHAAALYQMIFWVLTNLPAGSVAESVSDDLRIQQVIALMEKPDASVFDNASLARHISMNTNSFIRLFKAQTKMTPGQYILTRRINRACEMLHFTNKSIEQIAEECGFCDRYYFSRMFKKLRRIGPAKFRGIWTV